MSTNNLTFADGTPIPMIACYRGRPVTDLTRDELIKALNIVGDELAYWRTNALAAIGELGLPPKTLRKKS